MTRGAIVAIVAVACGSVACRSAGDQAVGHDATSGPESTVPTHGTALATSAPTSTPTTTPTQLSYEVVGIIGQPGDGPGQLDTPMGLAVTDDGRLLVADAGNARVQVLAADGAYLGTLGNGPHDTPLVRPIDVALGPDGTIWVADFGRSEVLGFDAAGNLVRRLGGRLETPAGLAVLSDGRVAVADFYGHQVHLLGDSQPVVLGGEGHDAGRLYYPTDVIEWGDNELLVVDAYNHRLQRFDREGDSLGVLSALANVGLQVPTGAAVVDDVVHIADSANQRVVAVDAAGHVIGQWMVERPTDSAIHSPSRVVAWRQLLYVVDPANGRVVVLRFEPGRPRRPQEAL